MSDMTPAMIEGLRHQFKTGMNRLLDCDELWNDKLSRAIADEVIDEANGHLDVIVNDREHFGPELVEKHYREMLRDIVAICKVSQFLVKWAKEQRDA
jgi:hypothetical protein